MTVLYLNHTCSEDAIQVNHRDTMNTEKNRTSPAGVGSADGDPISPYPGFTFLSTTTLRKPRGPRGYCRCWAVGRGTKNYRQRCALRPGGTPEEISRGQARAAGAAPGFAAEPARPQRGIEEILLAASSAQHFRQRLSPRAIFFDAPLGHGAIRHGLRGRRPLRRTCPRLICSGVPLGRGPGVPLLARTQCERCRNIPSLPFRFIRCDRGPVALRFGNGSTSLRSSRLCGLSSSVRLNSCGCQL